MPHRRHASQRRSNSVPPGRSIEGHQRRIMLPQCLTDRRTDHELEDLVLPQAGAPNPANVFVGDAMGVPGDLVDQRAKRLRKPSVVECGTPLGARCLALSFQYPRHECFTRLCHVRHLALLLALFSEHLGSVAAR
jgi:hypothetical protein